MKPLTDSVDIKKRRIRLLKKFFLGLFLIVLPLLFIYYIRGSALVHGPFLFFYSNPVTWKLPLIVFFISFIIFSIPLWLQNISQLKNKTTNNSFGQRLERRPKKFTDWLPLTTTRRSYYHSNQKRPSNQIILAVFLAWAAFFISLILAPALNGHATYNYYQFQEIKSLPDTKSVNLMPFQVANKIANLEVSRPVKPTMMFEDGQLTWSFLAAPSGVAGYFFKKSQGRLTQNGETTTKDIDFKKYSYQYSENIGLKDNLFLQLYQKDYFSKLDQAILLENGEIVVAKIKYRGSIFSLSKVPYLASVYLISLDGQIKELSVEEALARPIIKKTGQLIPKSLALDIQRSYQYKNGLFNGLFFYQDQIEIAGQPNLIDSSDGPVWLSAASTYSKPDLVKAIFLTDSLTGKNKVFFTEPFFSQTEVVKKVKQEARLNKVVEPRLIIKNNQPYFLLSIVENDLVKKSVIVDAKKEEIIKIFNHDQDLTSDQELREFVLRNNFQDLPTNKKSFKKDEKNLQEVINYLKESIKTQQELLRYLKDRD